MRRIASQHFTALQARGFDYSLETIDMTLSEPSTLPVILLAEDHPDDVFFMRLALQKAALANPLSLVRDRQDADQAILI